MKLSGIDFPKTLLDALSNDELVIFAGAGVSMGEPANLPNFMRLTEAIAEGTGKTPKDNESEDQFLGRLKHEDVEVHELAAEELQRNDPKPTELHHDLLRLFSKTESVRIVTTNFDLLFERAAEEEKLFGSSPEVFRAPALPPGNEFRGIVHVHGSLVYPEKMVLTDADFGRAYIVEGWAQRFLVELFGCFTVLFVGYSHNDTIMNYLARALPVEENRKRFVLTHEKEIEKWKVLGIKPIVYPCSSTDDHSALYEGIARLAKRVNWGVLDWQRRINELAEKEPFSLGEEEKSILDQALSDAAKVVFFIEAADAPQWVGWLDDNKYLDNLFTSPDLREPVVYLANWLAMRFAHRHPDQIFLLISRHGTALNPFFWRSLAWEIGRNTDQWDKNTLARWICLLLSTAAPKSPPDFMLLMKLGERCIEHGLFDDLVEIFDMITVSRLELYARPNFDTDGPVLSVLTEWKPRNDYYGINLLWEKGLKPNLDKIAEPLLSNVIRHLEIQHHRLSVWGNASRGWNPASMNRSAIEPHSQDRNPEPFDVLIDVARDCLEWLALNRPGTAARLCDRLAETEVLLLRRLALHALLVRKDLTPDEKIDWLLPKIDLSDTSVHHELFRAVTKTYSDARQRRRQKIIKAVLAYRWPDEEDENKDANTARVHFDWLHALHTAKPDCGFAKKALDKILKRFPNFQPTEHPEHLVWTSEAGWIGPQSPWTVEELLLKPAEEWIEKILSFRQEEFLGPDRQGLVLNITEAAKRDFQWGLVLAEALTDKKEWGTDIWRALLNAWAETGVTGKGSEEVLRLLGRTELYDKNALRVAIALLALVKDEDNPCPPSLLSQANEIARTLWENLDKFPVVSEKVDWPTRAINHPAGFLAQFWLRSLFLWKKRQGPLPCTLDDEYRSALSVIVQDESIAGRLGRCILAGHFSFLLDADEKWTKENLLPLFAESASEDDYHAAWGGFLVWQPITPSIVEILGHEFLEAVRRIKKQRHLRSGFIRAYTTMLVYFVTDPIDEWIPRFFEGADEADKRDFGFQVRRHLAHMDEGRKEELWQRWLRSYWEKRLKGIPPPPLESNEISCMLGWLSHLDKLFPEAVDLAVQMPLGSLERNFIVSDINKSDLWKNYPRAVVKLLDYLAKCDPPSYVKYEVKELTEKLLRSDITQELKERLKELVIKLQLT